MKKKTLFFCIYCKRCYKHRQSKFKHEKKCKYKNKINTNLVNNIIENGNKDEKDLLIEKLMKEADDLKKETDDLKKDKKIMSNQIDKLWDKVGDTNYQININNYGNENMDYITLELITNLIKKPYAAVPKLLKYIHFNPKHPENHNVKITNKKLPYVSVKKEDSWKFVDKNDMLYDMVDKSYNILDTEFENKDIDLTNNETKRYKGFRAKFNKGDKNLSKKLKKATELNILNHKI